MSPPEATDARTEDDGAAVRWRRLIAYWLDCVREDASFDARCPASAHGRTWVGLAGADTARLIADGDECVDIACDGPGRDLVRFVRKERGAARLLVGLPCWHDGRTAPRSGERTLWPLVL